MATPERPCDVPAQVDRLLTEAGGIEQGHVQSAQARIQAALAENRERATQLRERLAQSAAPLAAQEPAAHALLEALDTLETHASRAEASVGEITADIRWLDMAKRHVAQSIVTLRRLQMLVRSTFQLEQLCDSHQFREAASALQAVQALLDYFVPFDRVPYVLEQRAKMERMHERLRTMVLAEYEQAFQAPRARWDARESALPDAALVVEALGADVRDALLDTYCTRQLREYRRVFRAVDEAGQLDNVARRYAWIRRLLRTYSEEHAPAFLPAWHVDRRLLALFAELTFEDLRSTLVREQPRLHVDMLLHALHATQEFEAQVARQYNEPWTRVVGARRLSDAFAPYLGVFVEAQDKHLADMLAQHTPAPGGSSAAATAVAASREPTEPNLCDEPVRVLASSTDLVTFYRQTLERCAQLGPHAPVRELAHVYAKWLKRYAMDVLLPVAQQSRDTLELCTVLNTADYGSTTCTQLAQRVTEKLRALEGAGDAPPCVLDAERDAFLSVAAAALQALVRGLSTSLDGAFQALLRPEVPWTQREHVDDKSPWVDLLASGLESVAVVVRHHVENKRYVRSWCDKAVTLVTTRLLQTIVRLRPVRARAAAQWLADVQHVRTMLHELPHFSAPGRTWDAGGASQAMQASYARLVDRSIAKIEPILRVLAGPEEPTAMVAAYREHVQDQALPNFQKLLDLRGLRRPDQTPWVEAFLAAIDRAPDALPTTSTLSSLQLDPNADVYALPELGERRDESHDTSSPNRPSTPSSATAALSLPDWKKFGSMFGVALGQRRP
ncbi:Vacuolar protein sorting-associated protein 53 [Malassezia equina]|uniref:Vacuolar protein sorting-associated protein 53 n=1 Tax=Malassezia equina TaxID=1381935 RepID=A0AAF0EC47_9BASI|nr:Vacuolar protein sorting-associated protein 53 [Malassezia equina]